MKNSKRISPPPYKNKAFGLGSIFLAVSSVFASVNVASAQGFSGYYAPFGDDSNSNLVFDDDEFNPDTGFGYSAVTAASSDVTDFLGFLYEAVEFDPDLDCFKIEDGFNGYDSNFNVSATIIAPSSGSVSFDWSLYSDFNFLYDDFLASFEPLSDWEIEFGFLLNDNPTNLITLISPPSTLGFPIIVSESGVNNFNVNTGDVFGFFLEGRSTNGNVGELDFF